MRVRGGHHIFTRDGVAEILNLQPRGGQAKAHQVKQVRGVIVSYGLAGEPEAGGQAERGPQTRMWARRIRRAAMAHDIRHEINLHWSRRNQAFIAEVPEPPGRAADGATCQEALANVEIIIREWIETARELGRPVPEPRGRLMRA